MVHVDLSTIVAPVAAVEVRGDDLWLVGISPAFASLVGLETNFHERRWPERELGIDEATIRARVTGEVGDLRGAEPLARLARYDGRRLFRVHVVPAPGRDDADRPRATLTLTPHGAGSAGTLGAQRWFEHMVELSPDIVAVIDRAYRHAYVSPAIEPATGMLPSDFEGKDHRELELPEDLVEYFQSVYRHVFETGEEGTKEFEFPDPDGGVRHYASRVVPVVEPDGRIEVVISYARDVTELRRGERERIELEGKIRETQRLESLGLLAGGIAHDFNNLLTSILGTASLARAQLQDDAPLETSLRNIERASIQAAELCTQLLAYAGRGRVEKTGVAVEELIRETHALIKGTVPSGIEITFEVAPGLGAILADRSQIQQVVLNLLLNAIEAHPEHEGSVHIKVSEVASSDVDWESAQIPCGDCEGQMLAIEITDRGEGMSEETLSRIFDPFFSTKFTGRGLGLAATQGIIKSHGGALSVTSEVGTGTTFRLYLPSPHEATPAADLLHTEAQTASRTRRILIVDDQENVREIAAALAEAHGHSVLRASGGREALSILERERDVDLVLLDLTMPEIDGFETLTGIRRIRPSQKVVLMSGYTAVDIRQRTGDASLIILEKPFGHDRFGEAIEAAFRDAG